MSIIRRLNGWPNLSTRADLPLELPFKSSAIRQTGQVVRKSRLFANVQIGFELEQCSGPGQQQIEIGGISDVAQSADFVGPAKIFRAPARGSLHDDGNKLRHRIGPDSLGQFVAIHAGHHYVGYHQVRLIRLDGRERLITVRGSGYVVAGEAQSRLDQAQFIGIIVDDENVGF